MKGKKVFFGLGVILLFCTCVSNSAPTPTAEQTAAPDELDSAIREISNYLNNNLTRGNKLVILNIQSEFPALSEYIIDELIANTVNDRVFSVVDRQQLNTIRAELDFQMSGEVDDNTAQALGRMAGAQIIVSGAVSQIGDLYRLRIRALNVQSAQITGQFNRNISDGPTISALVKSKATGYGGESQGGAARIASPASAPTSAPVSTSVPTPAEKVYKIGDTGPAGGIVFYDKGNNSGGWRYLEAAPATTESAAQWRHNSGPLGEGMPTAVGNTSKEIGTGKNNTQNIMRYFNQNGGGFGLAAQICDELTVNGFDDWFLPSHDELSYMYGNLYRRGLGGFRNEWYYSSTTRSGDFYPVRINFANGEPDYGDSGVSRRVRAARRF